MTRFARRLVKTWRFATVPLFPAYQRDLLTRQRQACHHNRPLTADEEAELTRVNVLLGVGDNGPYVPYLLPLAWLLRWQMFCWDFHDWRAGEGPHPFRRRRVYPEGF